MMLVSSTQAGDRGATAEAAARTRRCGVRAQAIGALGTSFTGRVTARSCTRRFLARRFLARPWHSPPPDPARFMLLPSQEQVAVRQLQPSRPRSLTACATSTPGAGMILMTAVSRPCSR